MASREEETARDLVDYLRGGHEEDDRTLGDLWRDNTGNDVPEDLGIINELTQNDAVQGVVAAGAAGLAGAQMASAVLTTIGASTAAVPVIGWCVTAAVVIANTVLAVFTNASKLAEGRKLGRRQLEANNLIVSEAGLVPAGTRIMGGNEWGWTYNFEDAGREAAWWHLRSSELAGVMAGSYMEEGLHGHYRHAFLVDVETSRAYERDRRRVNEGFPVIDYRGDFEPIELSSGAKARTRLYGRGSLHINHDAPFFDFWRGGAPKLVRRMTAHLAASEAILTACRATDDVMVKRGIIAALLLSAQAQYADRGSRFGLGAPQDLEELAALLPAPVANVGHGQIAVLRENNRRAFSMAAVRSVAPHQIQVGRTNAIQIGTIPERLNVNVLTDSITPVAVFYTSASDLNRQVLVDWLVMRPGKAHGYRVSELEAAAASARRITPIPSFYTALPDGHEANAWLEATAGLWRIPNVAPIGMAESPRPLPFVVNPAALNIDLDAGGRDRAAGGGGAGGLLAVAAAGAALYLTTQ